MRLGSGRRPTPCPTEAERTHMDCGREDEQQNLVSWSRACVSLTTSCSTQILRWRVNTRQPATPASLNSSWTLTPSLSPPVETEESEEQVGDPSPSRCRRLTPTPTLRRLPGVSRTPPVPGASPRGRGSALAGAIFTLLESGHLGFLGKNDEEWIGNPRVRLPWEVVFIHDSRCSGSKVRFARWRQWHSGIWLKGRRSSKHLNILSSK